MCCFSTFHGLIIIEMLLFLVAGVPHTPVVDARGLPYVFLGDEGFPLKPWFMRPYSGAQLTSLDRKIYNYRLSRARRVIENTFGKKLVFTVVY